MIVHNRIRSLDNLPLIFHLGDDAEVRCIVQADVLNSHRNGYVDTPQILVGRPPWCDNFGKRNIVAVCDHELLIPHLRVVDRGQAVLCFNSIRATDCKRCLERAIPNLPIPTAEWPSREIECPRHQARYPRDRDDGIVDVGRVQCAIDNIRRGQRTDDLVLDLDGLPARHAECQRGLRIDDAAIGTTVVIVVSSENPSWVNVIGERLLDPAQDGKAHIRAKCIVAIPARSVARVAIAIGVIVQRGIIADIRSKHSTVGGPVTACPARTHLSLRAYFDE
ncbi:hypothetical protein HRbin20_01143 [bacterium HR20]|nr:hypothetical protein HRbin20_01143 [bacterium HR20]